MGVNSDLLEGGASDGGGGRLLDGPLINKLISLGSVVSGGRVYNKRSLVFSILSIISIISIIVN